MVRLKELLKQSPKDAFIRFAIAKEYEKSGDRDAAVQALRELLGEQPDYVGGYYHLAALLVAGDALDEAFDVYDRGIEQATMAGDAHALAELKNARLNLELETDR